VRARGEGTWRVLGMIGRLTNLCDYDELVEGGQVHERCGVGDGDGDGRGGSVA
jgi:hypothetical protein